MTISRSMFRFFVTAIALVITLGAGFDASAWGPNARQMICSGALPLTRQRVPDAFRGQVSNYEGDLFAGARDGIPALGGTFPLNDDVQCMDAVQSQIQILREARANGAGSYFAYRMGGLAALTSQVLIPFGVAHSDAEAEWKEEIDAYLEGRVEDFTFSVQHPLYQYILNTRLYLEKHRGFYDSDVIMIADDMKRGRGVHGMLAEAGPNYFEKSVHAVVDVWYTVLRPAGEASDVAPSREQMALYYIEEVKYLLKSKGNLGYAEVAYDQFKRYNAGMPMAHVVLGDAFYAYGTPESIARGVEEWVRAYDIPGEPRKAASSRLSKHFLEQGESLFERAHSPTAKDTDLDDALTAFESALQYDRSSDVAADRIQETTVAKQRRKEQYEMQEDFIAQALTAMQLAERAATTDRDFATAITSYNQAQMLVGTVSDQFKDLNAKARATSEDINKALKTVISDVFKTADEAVVKGDQALANNNVDEAVRNYSLVESIVDVVPSDENSPNGVKKANVIAEAQARIDEAEVQRRRLEQQQAAPAIPALPTKKN